jgi:hypothetical protein
LLQWLTSVSQGEVLEEVDAMHFISTFGGLVGPIDVAAFAIAACGSSPTIMTYSCDPAFAQMGGYFAAARIGDALPWIEFSFGGSPFRLAGVALEIPAFENGRPRKPAPGTLKITVIGDRSATWLCRAGEGRMEVAGASPGHTVGLTMVGENENGGWIFRFGTLRLWGSFIT